MKHGMHSGRRNVFCTSCYHYCSHYGVVRLPRTGNHTLYLINVLHLPCTSATSATTTTTWRVERRPRPSHQSPVTSHQSPLACILLASIFVMSCHVVTCRVASCRVVSCRVVSCRVVSCHVVSRPQLNSSSFLLVVQQHSSIVPATVK